jgi:ornithine cyclodeaminase/alanine dehydrogenase
MPTRILTRAEVARLCTMEMALDAVETAFAAHGRGDARMPVKVYLSLPEHAGDFRAMPAYLQGAAGVKWVNSHPQNPTRHRLPSVMGVYILSDPATARPLAIMDATLLTAFRTGAAAGVATRHLYPGQPASIGFIGAGVQARYLLAAHRALFAGFDILIADSVPEAAERFAAESGGRAVSTAEAAGCDVVCTSTPTRTPVVERAQVRPGAHLNAMGADAPGKQELATDLLLAARVFVDDLDQASESGEVNVPLHEGALTRGAIAGTLGQVVAGALVARPVEDGVDASRTITVFDSTGLAVQDLSLARVLYAAAVSQGVGEDVSLVD